MKSRLKNIVAFFLGVIILLSSNGIVLATHSCFSRPGTQVSLFSHKGCCSKGKKDCHRIPAGENTFTKKCCQLKISFHKVDVSSFLSKANLIHVDAIAQHFSISDFPFSKNYTELLFINKSPPKPAGRALLCHISLLLI